MKLFITLCCFALITISSCAPNPNMEMLKPLVMQCQTEEGGTDSDSSSMMNAKVPGSPEGHCMMTCVHEKVGVVSLHNLNINFKFIYLKLFFLSKIKSGKVDKAAFIEIGKQVVKNDEKLVSVVSDLANECEPSVNGKERCEMGLTFGMCLQNGMVKRNVKLDFF